MNGFDCALVTREFPPAPCGGIGSYTANVARLMAEAGHRVHVITEAFPGSEALELREGMTIHRLPFRDHRRPGICLHPDIAHRLDYRHLLKFRDPMRVFSLQVRDYLETLLEREPIQLIEAPEYEAPLYDFLLARLMRPDFPKTPAVVHLHSASRDLAEHDLEDVYSRFLIHRRQNEEMAIALADAVVSPSQFLKNLTEERMDFAEDRIATIPLPLGEFENIEVQRKSVEGRILFVGRFQHLKGVDLLLDAGRRLMEELPQISIRMIGGDCHQAISGQSWLESLPNSVRSDSRWEFIDHMSREDLVAEFSAAEIVCIPSRFENFPNVCIEAMACAAPVVAARVGGLAEMIEDGKSGWHFEAGDADSLYQTLAKTLKLDASARRTIGEAARERVLHLCGNEKNIRLRETYFQKVIEAFDEKAISGLPDFLPHPHSRPDLSPCARRKSGSVSVIIPCYNLGAYLGDCVASVKSQSRPADEIIIVDDGSTDPQTREVLSAYEFDPDVHLERTPNRGLPSARNHGRSVASGDYLVFLDADDLLKPDYIAKLADVLDRHEGVGAVTPWVRHFGAQEDMWIPPHGQFPYLLAENCLAAASMVRARALDQCGGFQPAMQYNYEDWEFWIQLAEAGWALLCYPEALLDYRVRPESMIRGLTPQAHGYLRRIMVALHPELFHQYGAELSLIIEQRYRGWPQDYAILQAENDALRAQSGRLRRALRNPLQALRQIARKIF